MSTYKEHKVRADELLKVIPEELLSRLSQSTKVDYYSKTPLGHKMFYLLMYVILESDQLNLNAIWKISSKILTLSVCSIWVRERKSLAVPYLNDSAKLPQIIFARLTSIFINCFLNATHSPKASVTTSFTWTVRWLRILPENCRKA